MERVDEDYLSIEDSPDLILQSVTLMLDDAVTAVEIFEHALLVTNA